MAFPDTVEADALMVFPDISVVGHICFLDGGYGIVMHDKIKSVEEKASKVKR